jgi:hypothetical protein
MTQFTAGAKYALKCLGNDDGPRLLDGRTHDGSVGLAPNLDKALTGTLWDPIDQGDGNFVLKCLGKDDGPRFLDGRTRDGTVGLASATDGPFTGTHWKLMRLYDFGIDKFHVENCRSKGDHNDSDTMIVVVTSDKQAFAPQQILLGGNLHANDDVFHKFVGPFPIAEDELVTVTYTVLNGMGGDNGEKVAIEIVGAVLAGLPALAELHFLGLAGAKKLEEALLSAVGGALGIIGQIIPESNPNCAGPVAVRTIVFLPGQLQGMEQTFGPVLETQRSPSECGNDPHSTIIYSARPS